MLLLQVAEETSKSIPYKIGYAVGYYGHTYFWEIMAFLFFLVAGLTYFFIKRRNSRKLTQEL